MATWRKTITRLQKSIQRRGWWLLLVLLLWREMSLKYLIFPLRHLSELLPCNEPPDCQSMNHPGDESNSLCYEEEWRTDIEARWRFKSFRCYRAISLMSHDRVYPPPTSEELSESTSSLIPHPHHLMARWNRDWFLPPQTHTSAYEGVRSIWNQGISSSPFSRPKPCCVLVPLWVLSLSSWSFDKGSNLLCL